MLKSPSQKNFIGKKKHQHILNVTRNLLFQSNLPINFWSYAFSHAIHLINTIPHVATNRKTSYLLVHKQLHDLKNLNVFGSLVLLPLLEEINLNLILD